MAVPSSMVPLGTAMPAFVLPDTVTGARFDSNQLAGSPALVAFLCNHCPYVRHIADTLAGFGRFCDARGVRMVGISANDAASYPDDAPDQMTDEARKRGYTFPYLYDESQAVAKRFDAVCTPEFFLYDAGGKLAYRGQFDESRPKNAVPVTGADLRAAVEALLESRRPSDDQRPSIGCSIKWR